MRDRFDKTNRPANVYATRIKKFWISVRLAQAKMGLRNFIGIRIGIQ
jgi:hypothetical protein